MLLYNQAITAVTMRIQRLVGTVNLYTEGKEKTIKEKMRLSGGQTVTTAGESLIMVSLDDTKLMTMEESSKAEIEARGKKLLFRLLEGNLFFNVTEKLKDSEAFDVHTSTMVCGIRGTSAYVGRDSTSHEILMVTDGVVHVIATNPVTKETTEVDVPAGQMITVYLDEEAEGDKTISIVMQPFKEEDLPALALDTLRINKALMEKVTKATGFKAEKLIALAELSSSPGVSMYGSAADALKSEGISDSIPYMGYRSSQMVYSANSAVNIAKEDLPLEIAIIKGYRDVMDVGSAEGYDRESMGTLMDGTRAVMEETFVILDQAGINSVDRMSSALKISETLRISSGRMAQSDLSPQEIAQVLEAEKQLYTEAARAVARSASDGAVGTEMLASLDMVGEHITGTVDDEMNKASNGGETAEALLRRGTGTDGGETGAEEFANTADTVQEKTENTTDGAAGDGGAAAGATVNGNAAGGQGGATSAELRQSRDAIAFTNPETGVVALKDGTLFDPAYYAAANPDVVARYGADTAALLAEWLAEGKAQGRPPIAPATVMAKTEEPAHFDPNAGRENSSSSSDDDDDDDDHHDDSSSSSSGSGGGGSSANSPNVIDNGDGTFTITRNTGGPPIGGVTVTQEGNYITVQSDMGSFDIPVRVNGVDIETFDQVHGSVTNNVTVNKEYYCGYKAVFDRSKQTCDIKDSSGQTRASGYYHGNHPEDDDFLYLCNANGNVTYTLDKSTGIITP